jgi:mannose-6-phosphate isomerase-like protein (cupin superfamily)
MLESVPTSFLAGKVRKWSLPVVRVPSGAGTPHLKRLLLPQGELAQFYDADEGIRYIAMIQLRAGNSRGNHYHKIKQEFLYVLEGEVLLIVEDIQTQARASLLLQGGDVAFIETNIAHVLQILQPGHAIEFSSSRFDPADIYRVTLAS